VKVIVDTAVWSLALRRRKGAAARAALELAELIREGRVELLGAIRQELLSGVRERSVFELLRERLRSFPDLPLVAEDYELAAEYFNTCRRRGIQGSNTDLLLCAAAQRRDLAILTTDEDFRHFARILPIRLLASRDR
jgi:predicted nucleic acid-binding protein